jgi:dephospho-CoA kinase
VQTRKFTVGLTGGIASGKSFVADCFTELGASVVDTDVVAREVVQPGQPALDEIRQQFGDTIIGDDGAMNRSAMREIVFSDDDKRRQLEAILHPKIRQESFAQVERAEGPYVIVVVPLLYESPMRERMDRILVVDCSEETQLARLMARDNESAERGRRIMATQATREERLSIADDIIDNDGAPEATRENARALHQKYLQLADPAD